MKRRIIKQGHNTLTITLPSSWVKQFNLKAGQEIDLVERGNNLIVGASKLDDYKKVEFDISDLDIPTIWKYFMVVYREGYDEIKVKFNSLRLGNPYKFYTPHSLDKKYKGRKEEMRVLEALQQFVNRFIGMEIVEHGKDYIIIREMADLTPKQFDNSLRRVFLIFEQMCEVTNEAINNNDPLLVQGMHDIDINLDKFHDYCIRVLNKTGHKDSQKTSLLFSTLFLIELACDEFKNIAKHLLEDMKKPKFNNLRKMSNLVLEEIRIYVELFYKYSVDKVKELSSIDQEIYRSFNAFYVQSKVNEDEKEIFTHLRRISRYVNALYELRIEMEF